MKTATRAVLFIGTLLCAAPALAQYYPTQPAPPPPPPPPQYYPPPPPPQYYPPPPPVYYRPVPTWDGKTHYTIRISGGVGFIGAGYYCYYYGPAYSCGAGYSSVQPDVNLDVDIWLRPTLGITLGTNVLWGSYTPGSTFSGNSTINSTTWEPHVDFLFSPPYSDQLKGRVRVGFGLYVANANDNGVNPAYNNVGGAFRLGFGASILPKSTVGIGIDAIFEAGWIGSQYVSTVQLLLGPELHF